MKLFTAIATAVAVVAATSLPVNANTSRRICTFNNGYGTPVQARMPCIVIRNSNKIVVNWNDGIKDIYTLQFGNSYTDSRGGIWRLTTTRETGPIAALLYNPANNNQVIIE